MTWLWMRFSPGANILFAPIDSTLKSEGVPLSLVYVVSALTADPYYGNNRIEAREGERTSDKRPGASRVSPEEPNSLSPMENMVRVLDSIIDDWSGCSVIVKYHLLNSLPLWGR